MTSKKFSAKRPLTDDEEAEIQRMIASDPDNPELTDEQIAGLRPFAEVLPALAESARRGPGRPKLDKTLEPVTLRLDPSGRGAFPRSGRRLAQTHGAGVGESGVLNQRRISLGFREAIERARFCPL